jgi:hypothetical protein
MSNVLFQNKRRMNTQEARLLFGRGYFVNFDQFAHLLKQIQEGCPRAELAGRLGVSRAKISALIAMSHGFDLLERGPKLCLTQIGMLITCSDPFFEDRGTLWFLHYVVASKCRHLVWNQFVTNFFARPHPFTLAQFRTCIAQHPAYPVTASAKVHLRQESRLVLDAYLNKNFARLGYLLETEHGLYLSGNHSPLPTLVLGASIARYRDHYHPADTTVRICDLLSDPNSPVVIFQLSEQRLRIVLEQLKSYAGLALESRADLDQVRLDQTVPDAVWMERYYASI